jgi:hypothetical protein
MDMTTQQVLTEDQQRAYLLSRIGQPVSFKYPEPPYLKKGKLLDRIIAKSGEDEIVGYWNLIDLINFDDEKEDWLRISYYRYKKKENRWVFAGQTSLTDPISQFEELFVKGIKEKEWVKKLFKKVLLQCEPDLK